MKHKEVHLSKEPAHILYRGSEASFGQVFNISTLLVKFVSCAAAVGSGLPVGPEGPMVHIGAMVGAALSQGHSTTLGFHTGCFRRFQNPRDKRDFVTAGVCFVPLHVPQIVEDP